MRSYEAKGIPLEWTQHDTSAFIGNLLHNLRSDKAFRAFAERERSGETVLPETFAERFAVIFKATQKQEFHIHMEQGLPMIMMLEAMQPSRKREFRRKAVLCAKTAMEAASGLAKDHVELQELCIERAKITLNAGGHVKDHLCMDDTGFRFL